MVPVIRGPDQTPRSVASGLRLLRVHMTHEYVVRLTGKFTKSSLCVFIPRFHRFMAFPWPAFMTTKYNSRNMLRMLCF